jgi:hypothetical protein
MAEKCAFIEILLGVGFGSDAEVAPHIANFRFGLGL